MTAGKRPQIATILQVGAAWLTPFTLAALAFGAFLTARNSAAGVPWTGPAVFCGVAAAALMAIALAFGLFAHVLFRLAGARAESCRTARTLAAIASFIAFSYLGYQTIREYEVETWARYAAGIGAGTFALFVSFFISNARAARAICITIIGLGIFSILAGAAAVWHVRSPAAAGAGAPDPRDFVSNFPPLENPPPRAPTAGRLFVIGVDGATWDRIDPLIAEGKLPNFAKLRKDGATARLRTLVPTASPVIWTSIATGQLPKVHGIDDFVVRRTAFLPLMNLNLLNRPMRAALSGLQLYTVVPITSNFRRCKAIWNIASEVKVKSCTVGWWASYPAEPVDGWIVSDATSNEWTKRLLGSQEKLKPVYFGATYPEDLGKELAPLHRRVVDITRDEISQFFPVDDATWREFLASTTIDRDSPMSILHSSYLRDEFFVASALKIDQEKKPSILLCYTRLTDDLAHFFWQYTEAEAAELGVDAKAIERYKGVVDKTYAWADGVIGKFMQRMAPADTLVVVSDHGWERASRGMYNHNNGPDGILAIYGPGVIPGVLKEKPHVFDICPTLLYLAGIPKGDDMPGRPIVEAFAASRPAPTIPTWETTRFGRDDAFEMMGAEERARILEALGYTGHDRKK